MKKGKNILTLLALSLLTACSSDDLSSPTYTVGEADNAIVLGAGIAEGGSGVTSRAVDGNNSKHVAFSTENKTQLRLRVDGKWRKSGTVTNDISYATTATTGAKTGTGNLHNELSFSPVLYWDDYGTADPENMSTSKGGTVTDNTDGRGIGLTVYGVGVNEKNLPTSVADGRTALSTLTTSDDFKNITWNVGKVTTGTIDQSTNGWGDYDLLTSNNIQEGTGFDGTYKFDDYTGKSGNTPSDIIEFTHAMSKITIRLIAGEGFPTSGVGGTTKKFAAAPEVILTSNEGTANTNTEWPLTSGNVNVETKVVSSQTAPAKITMHQGTVPSTDVSNYTVIYDALVMPGSMFEDKGAGASDPYPVIARIKADDNIYYVTSEKIRAKMSELNSSTDYKTESGKNYIITATINKTEIKVTATITDWIDVEADPVTPTINVTADWGTTTGATNVDGFSFYRSLELNNGYSNGFSANANNYFAAEAIAKKPSTDGAQWVFNDGTEDIKLYWPTHDTHYQFRGVWPTTSTITTDTETSPHVKAQSATDNTQIIEISNVAYKANSYPSDLMIARPEFGSDTDGNEKDPECTNNDHTHKKLYSQGICATEGKITMNFRYVMSQVEVELQTVTGDAAVNIGENTKVEIVNVANDGYVKLGDRVVVPNTQDQNYMLNPVSTDGLTGDGLAKAQRRRHSAIVPQALTYSTPGKSTNLRFKITIYKDDSTTDVDDIYYADINPILVSENGGTKAATSAWESGKHYKYILTLSKTEIKVTATISPWVTVNAEENVWF